MKIGIFSDSWVPNLNGVVISIINEIQSLRNKHEFAIFVPKLKQAIPFKIEGVPIYELKSFPFPPYPGYNIAFPSFYLTKALHKEQFDFIHCHSPFSLGYAAVLASRVLNNIPLLNTYHTHLVDYSGHLVGGIQGEKFARLSGIQEMIWGYIRWYYKYSDVVITPSKTFQRELTCHGVKPPVYSLPNMISSVFFRNDHSKEEQKAFQENIRKKYEIKSDRKILLYCGRISYEKKLEVLLKAYKEIEQKYPKTFLLIVGDGPHLKMYKKQASQLNIRNIAFTGFFSHTKLPYLYRMGEFMVTPSDTETQGLTVIEAMSQGLPVIGAAGGGVLDYIHENRNGLLFPPGNWKACKAAIETLLDNPDLISQFGRTALKIAQKFSTKGFTTQLERAFSITIKINASR
ncbi:MAG: glycosyltransferase family 4 protein [Candidatus Heimdallarchaeota archaeon]|nr:glycosyltransferase family 4 protein [Candidatus Heimdallarchaeota archaeon]